MSKVKEMILESFFHVDDSIFKTHVRSALIEMPCIIQGMVDNGENYKLISLRLSTDSLGASHRGTEAVRKPVFLADNFRPIRGISMLARIDDDSPEEQISVVRSVVHFVVICWHKGCENCILRGSASTLLNLMAGLTSMASARPMPLSELLCDLWTALTITSGCPNLNVNISTDRQIGLWDFTVTRSRTSLIVASE